MGGPRRALQGRRRTRLFPLASGCSLRGRVLREPSASLARGSSRGCHRQPKGAERDSEPSARDCVGSPFEKGGRAGEKAALTGRRASRRGLIRRSLRRIRGSLPAAQRGGRSPAAAGYTSSLRSTPPSYEQAQYLLGRAGPTWSRWRRTPARGWCHEQAKYSAPADPLPLRPLRRSAVDLRNGRGQTARRIGHPPPRDILPACAPALRAATLSRLLLISLARRTIDSCPNHDSSRALRLEAATVLAGPAGVHAHSPRACQRRPLGALAGQEAARGRGEGTRPRF